METQSTIPAWFKTTDPLNVANDLIALGEDATDPSRASELFDAAEAMLNASQPINWDAAWIAFQSTQA